VDHANAIRRALVAARRAGGALIDGGLVGGALVGGALVDGALVGCALAGRALVGCALVGGALAGCAHSHRNGWRWSDRDTAFHVGALAADWRPVAGKADLAFRDPRLDAVIMANADCNERDAPLPVLANSLVIGFTERQITHEETVALAGRDALHRELTAKLDGVPVALDAFVLKKDGCVYDLVYSAPPERYAAGKPAFAGFVAGFDTERVR
jgi:hypothetical protein